MILLYISLFGRCLVRTPHNNFNYKYTILLDLRLFKKRTYKILLIIHSKAFNINVLTGVRCTYYVDFLLY